jgi:hypothetical protein
MNVVEKFLEKFNHCIILLSGFEQLHLSDYAKNLSENLSFDLIKFNYPDYDSLNNEIQIHEKEKKGTGLVIYGLSFLKDSLKFKPIIHISLSGSKALINDDEKYQIYTDNVKNSFINKFKNIKDLDYHDQIYEDIFNLVLDIIMKRIYGDRYDEVQKEYVKMSDKERYDTPKKSDTEDDSDKDKDNDESEKIHSPIGGRRKKKKNTNKNNQRIIGTRLLQERIRI